MNILFRTVWTSVVAVGMLVAISVHAEPAEANTMMTEAQCTEFAESFAEASENPMALMMGVAMIDGQLAKLETATDKTEEEKETARTSLTFAKSELGLAITGDQGEIADIVARCMAVEY